MFREGFKVRAGTPVGGGGLSSVQGRSLGGWGYMGRLSRTRNRAAEIALGRKGKVARAIWALLATAR